MSNYPPISILPVISKVFDKVVAEQLVEHPSLPVWVQKKDIPQSFHTATY